MAETITVSQSDIQSSVTFLEQYLSSYLPNYDFGKGTANRDIAVNSVALTIAYIKQEILNVRNRQSLKTITDLPSSESVDDTVDEILSNWFITRKTGNYSQGVVTLFFSTDEIGAVYITESDLIRKDDTVMFKITETDLFIIKEDLVRNVGNTGSVYYTYTLPVICTEPGDNDLDPGTFLNWTIASSYLYRIENFSKFSGGKGTETTEELVSRSETTISVRDLNIARSIHTTLTNEFFQVQDLVAVGYGDTEFQRDLLKIEYGSGDPVWIHRGSMMDIWTKFPLTFSQEMTLTVQSGTLDGVAKKYLVLPSTAILRVTSLKDPDVNPNPDVAYTTFVNDITTSFSDRQVQYLVVSDTYSVGKSFTVGYDTVVSYEAVQAFCEDEHNRVLVADPLIKLLHPMYLKFDIRYTPTALTLDTSEARTSIQTFIHDYQLRNELSVSQIMTYFTKTYADYLYRVELPLVVVGTIHTSTGQKIITNYTDRLQVPEQFYYDDTLLTHKWKDTGSTGYLTGGDCTGLYGTDVAPTGKKVVNSTDIQLSANTVRYVLPLEDITITAI